jgi:hypothetical protein
MKARFLAIPLTAALLAAACQAPGPARARGATTRPARTTATPRGEARPTATPAIAPAPAAPVPLVAPPDTAPLTGVVRQDASYVLASGQGRLVSKARLAPVAFGDAANVAAGGANLVANNGGTVLAAWAPGLLSDNGLGLIANNSGSLVSDAGGGLVSDAGGGLISDNGLGIVSKTKYALRGAPAFGLAQADEAAPTVGELRPAAGMVVGAVDLRTGELLPVGRTPAGAAAYAVFTDAAGAYTLHLPAATTGNVVVVAVPPTTAAIDHRLDVERVTPPRGTAALDEDTALATLFLRAFLLGRITNALLAEEAVDLTPGATTAGEALRVVIGSFFEEINAGARASGLQRASREEGARVAQRLCDVALAQIDVEAIMIRPELAPEWKKPPEPAFALDLAVLEEVREAAGRKLQADPKYFEGVEYVRRANEGRAAADAYVIAKPADLGDFLVREYLLPGTGVSVKIDAVFNDLGLGTTQADNRNTRRFDFEAAGLSLSAAIVQVLLENRGGAHDEVLRTIADWKPAR